MKRALVATAIVLVVLGLVAAASAVAARKALQAIEEQRHDILGLAIDIHDYAVDWKRASLSLRGIRIYPAGHEEESALLASADELAISLRARDILRKTVHARNVTLRRPQIALLRTREGFNWGALRMNEGTAEGKDRPAASGTWRFIVDAVRIEDGAIDYRDLRKGHRIELANASLSLTDLVPEEDPAKLPTKLSLRADLDHTGGRIAVDGALNAFAPGINFQLTATLSGTPIGYFRSFYAGTTPYPIQAGSIAVRSQASSERSQLRSDHHATITGLRVGGGIKGDLINKFVLSRGGRIDVDAAVNGDLSTGELSVGTAIANNFNAVIAAQAKEFSATEAATALKAAGTQVESRVRSSVPTSVRTPVSKVKGLFRR